MAKSIHITLKPGDEKILAGLKDARLQSTVIRHLLRLYGDFKSRSEDNTSKALGLLIQDKLILEVKDAFRGNP